MKPRLGVACVLAAGFSMTSASAVFSPTDDPVNVHLAAAQRAAGLDYPGLLARVCIVPPTGGDAAAGLHPAGRVNGLNPAAATPLEGGVSPRSQRYHEPHPILANPYYCVKITTYSGGV